MGQRGARNRRAEGAAFGGRHVNFLHLKYFLMVAEELNITCVILPIGPKLPLCPA